MSGGSYGNSDKDWSHYRESAERHSNIRRLHERSISKSISERERREAEHERVRLETEARLAEEDRLRRLDEARRTVAEKKERKRREDIYDKKCVRLGITKPKTGVERVHIVLVDNSGSNRLIARHLRNSSGHLVSALRSIDPQSQIAFCYFSDHCDGEGIRQEVDYITPDEEGDKILNSTVTHIRDVSGGDEAEAIECALLDMCNLDFGEAKTKHLYLVTDVVGHGMGLRSDDGCPFQRDWRNSLDRVREVFDSFEVIGCSENPHTGKLQQQFVAPERLAYDLIDLSQIREHEHRLAVTGNTLLFLIARRRGTQTAEMFLGFLYEKWNSDPVFGANTDLRAKEAIRRFAKYLETPAEETERMLARIFGE